MTMHLEGRLWRVEAPHFVADLVEAHDGVIVHTAPILRWAANKPMRWFQDCCQHKRWKCEPAR